MAFKSSSRLLILLFVLSSCKETNEELINKAVRLSKKGQHDKAIEINTEVIRRNPKLQLAYYNRGIEFTTLKKYDKALADFDKIMSFRGKGPIVYIPNPNSPFASEEDRFSVSYYDALYERAQIKYHMDSLRSSFRDFQELIDNYYEKSNCYVWQGTLWIKASNKEKACECYVKAKYFASKEEDRQQAEEMLKTYCPTSTDN